MRDVTIHRAANEPRDGLRQNGLRQNGLRQNGLRQDGLRQNGLRRWPLVRFWALGLATVITLVMAAPATALKKPVDAEELFNPLLGVEYSHWLVGPIFHMATDKEVEEYLALTSDEEAVAFVRAFWDERNKDTEVFKKTPEQLFEQRAETADSRYSEGTFPGRLTDRGAVYVLFGEPEKIEFESSELLDGPPIETWKYAKSGSKGLNGEKPKKEFRFLQVGGKTRFFTNSANERETRRRGRNRIRF